MNIYVIATSEAVSYVKKVLSTYGGVVILPSGRVDINVHAQIFNDPGEKIFALNPSLIGWQLSNETLGRINYLKAICTSSAWTRFIDLDYCKLKGIAVTHTFGANSHSVAEYAIWMMLSLAKKLPLQIKDDWRVVNDQDHVQVEIAGKSMGVIGLGNIGSRVAKLGGGLGMKVVYWNRSNKQSPYERVEVDDLLKNVDVVFNCLEICDETQDFLNKERLKLMKSGAFFISVLGGMGWGVEDDKYLIEMVECRRLAGFAVENGHNGKYPMRFKGNVFVPAERAHYTTEANERIYEQWTEGIIGVITGNNKFRLV